ncbi:MAG: RimK family alpha-L-glutamate ligase, partial [Bacteroidota bacterium]
KQWFGRQNGIHAIIPRVGASGTFHGASVIQQFEMMGVYSILSSEPLLRARNKLRSFQMMSRSGIRLPRTAFGSYTERPDFLLESVGGAPVVIKVLSGTHGMGVILAESRKTAESIIEAFQKLKEQILLQEYIREARGEDIRALVVGDEVVASMKRKAPPGEFRANLHRGASSSPIKLTSTEINTAKEACRLLGLKVAGVDMLQSHRGPLLIELNPSPGLEGIEETTKIDVAGKIIELIETEASKRLSR